MYWGVGRVSRIEESFALLIGEALDHGDRFVRAHSGCSSLGSVASGKGYAASEFIDLPIFGRSARLVWHKRQMSCPAPECERKSFTEEDGRIAGPRPCLNSRGSI